jgi:hypothetical protein
MILSPLSELLLYPVAERGIPNQERIPILVQETIDLGRYGIMAGYAGNNGFATPIQDNLFWFGDGVVKAGDWIFIYTGTGSPSAVDWAEHPDKKIYTVHWGRSKTMFANSQIVPILFRTDTVAVGIPTSDLPQLGSLNF